MTVSQRGGRRGTMPMTVKNMGFLIDRMGEDCSPLQFVRELTQNAIEGINALPEKTGEIHWDVDWTWQTLTGVHKLAIIDTGLGMTGEEMCEYINRLSSSIHEQSNQQNYGIGAKISALPRNHAGLLYLSWKDGVGYHVWLWRDPETGDYGLKQFERPDGEFEYWTTVEDEMKPKLIKDHGTMVVLLGENDNENTMQPPEGAAMPSRWILRYLNSRYLRFPDTISVQAREGWEVPKEDSKHNFLRAVTGMEPWLTKVAQASGAVSLTGAQAQWWILKEELDTDAGHYAPGGHIAAVYKGELYELKLGRSGTARLSDFGIIFGHRRIVVYVAPDDGSANRLTTNTARTQLMIANRELPWSDWASEFRDKMPPEIAALMEQIASAAKGDDNRNAIKDRLKAIADLFKFSRYRRTEGGPVLLDEDSLVPGGRGSNASGGGGSGGGGGGSGGGRGSSHGGNIYAFFQDSKGVPGRELKNVLDPLTAWVSVKDQTRTVGDMEDRAAKYIPSQHRLLINADFRVFRDMIERWCKRYSRVPGARTTIEGVVREWFEQQLIEAILGARAIRESSQWDSQEQDGLWSEVALTAVVMPRYHVEMSIRRALGSKLGALERAP